HLSGVPAVEPLAEEFQFWKIACGSDAAPIETKLARAGLDRSRVQTGADGRWLMAHDKWMSISPEPSAMSHYLVLADQLPQYVRQDAAVTEGDEFFRRVDASDRLKFDRLPIVAHGTNGDRSARFEALCDADEFERLAPGDAERRGGLSCFELQREDTHVHEVAAVDALEGFGDHRLHAEQQGPFCRPVARRSRSVLLAGDDEQRHVRRLVLHRGVVDRHDLVRRHVRR